MPGHELVGKEELDEIKKIFKQSDGVLFAHGFDQRRKNIFRVRKFEKEISKLFKSKYVQCVSSGTAALKIALKSAGVGHNDEVITQGFNFIATIEAIVDCGAKPIITGINDDLNLDFDHLKKLVTKKNKSYYPRSYAGLLWGN
jgi:8-amino-3,8-dideoxy-alpha-D-manno-octulosonate transaminase